MNDIEKPKGYGTEVVVFDTRTLTCPFLLVPAVASMVGIAVIGLSLGWFPPLLLAATTAICLVGATTINRHIPCRKVSGNDEEPYVTRT